MNRLRNLSSSQRHELVLLGCLALLALMLTALLATGPAAVAGPLAQDSPVSPLDSLSPPTEEPTATMAAPTPTAVPTPTPVVPEKTEPPIPVPVLVGIMAVIGLVALGVVLRRG